MRAPDFMALGWRLNIADHSRAFRIRAGSKAKRDGEHPHQPHTRSVPRTTAVALWPTSSGVCGFRVREALSASVRGCMAMHGTALIGAGTAQPVKPSAIIRIRCRVIESLRAVDGFVCCVTLLPQVSHNAGLPSYHGDQGNYAQQKRGNDVKPGHLVQPFLTASA